MNTPIKEADVEEIYKAYPRKAAPKKAAKAIRIALKNHTKAVILAGIARMNKALEEQHIKGTPLWSKIRYPQGYFTYEMFLMEPEDLPWYGQNPTRFKSEKGKYDRFK